MTLYFEKEVPAQFDFDCETVAREVVEAVLDYENCPYEAEVSLTLTNNEEIHKINLEQRGIDAPTDVLSFPMTDYPNPGEFDFLEEADDCFNPETGELLLGDIVLSAERVKSQAEDYGHSELREYAFLIAHSMLHLLGYDHMEEEERVQMEAKQEEILQELHITRDKVRNKED